MLRQLLMDELTREEAELAKFKEKLKQYQKYNLTYTTDKRGFGRFYCQVPGHKKRKYVRRSDEDLLRSIAYGRYVQETVSILEQNIGTLTKMQEVIRDCDSKSIIESLPDSYRRAIEMLKISKSNQVLQSENPIDREELVHEVSNGLFVRSKGEVIIAELLIRYGIRFQYERALELTLVHVEKDGYTWQEKVVKYPDFTIFLADGSVLYWEHLGMFDIPKYRSRNFDKFKLYYDNDIYPPKNLIITMDDNSKPIRTRDYIDIIVGQILPYV